MHLSFKRSFFTLATMVTVVYIMYIARSLLIPITYALIISLILYPIVRKLTNKGFSIVWAILTTMMSLVVLIAGIIYFFSSQIIVIAREYDNFLQKLNLLFSQIVTFINTRIQTFSTIESDNVKDKLMEKLEESGIPLVSDTLSFTGTFFTFLILTIIYIFLILLHHRQFAQALTQAAPKPHRDRFYKILKQAQKVGQKYLTGMGALILIIGTLNSIGLLILGIDYAFFFGFLASLLAIIPYVGTTLGGLIPTLYAFMTYDSYWYPLGVILIFWFVQLIEGNFLSPNIVGGNLNLNAMAALVSLIAGGLLWGISGMILSLPLAAILKVFCENYEELKPLSLLMSDTTSSGTRSKGLVAKIKGLFSKK